MSNKDWPDIAGRIVTDDAGQRHVLPVRVYFEDTDAGGIVAKTVALVPNGAETVSVVPGDRWQGVYRLDSINVKNGAKLTRRKPSTLLRAPFGSTSKKNESASATTIAASPPTIAAWVIASCWNFERATIGTRRS